MKSPRGDGVAEGTDGRHGLCPSQGSWAEANLHLLLLRGRERSRESRSSALPPGHKAPAPFPLISLPSCSLWTEIQCKGRPCVWRSACGWRHSNSIIQPFFFPLWDQRYLNLKFKRKEKPQSKCVLISFQIIFFTLSHRYSSKFYVLVFLLNLNIEKQRLSSYSFSLEQHKRKSSMCLIMS